MTDPAVEADRRAAEIMRMPRDEYEWVNYGLVAAREALAPLRELHKSTDYAYCRECEAEWPCDTAKLIYPESEL